MNKPFCNKLQNQKANGKPLVEVLGLWCWYDDIHIYLQFGALAIFLIKDVMDNFGDTYKLWYFLRKCHTSIRFY